MAEEFTFSWPSPVLSMGTAIVEVPASRPNHHTRSRKSSRESGDTIRPSSAARGNAA